MLPAAALALPDDYPATAQGAADERAINAPARDSIYSCDAQNMPVAIARPWVSESGLIDFSKKPIVPGDVHWQSVLTVNTDEETISGNGLPKHPTGEYPVRDATVARFDRNPNSIQSQNLYFRIPQNPQLADAPTCLPKGPIGVMLTGAAIFNALDGQNRDAVATEIFDKCEGHPERNGMYHYHHYSPCFDSGPRDQPSPLLGYALDGFGIYGPRGEGGHMITNRELDECHGTTSAVTDAAGRRQVVYHYVLNNEFPYSLGCFRGTPAPRRHAGPGPGPGMQGGHMRRPPDLNIAAQKLGISAEELRDALGPPPPDLNAAAHTLGITVQQLRDALGPPPEQ
jgi:hypothetical protein